MKYVVDSSGWLEYFSGSENAKNYSKAIEDTKNLIVPTISIHEVFKKVLKQKGENMAFTVTAHMKQGLVIDLDLDISLLAAKLGVQHKLPMADSLILATAKRHQATLLTQDSDFIGLDGVKFFGKK